jgi:hypothetical protein
MSRICPDEMEDAMRHVSVPANATASAFQLGALLVVGAFFLLILAHDLANGPAPVAGPSKPFGVEPVASQTMDQHIAVP